MAWLTKSRFISGLQCHKRLWSEIHAPIEEPTPDQVTFINGRAVDELVRKLQPGPEISRARGMPDAIADTTRLLKSGIPDTLHQPAFRVGDLAVIADVLRHQHNHYSLIEVKSSTAIKPQHLPDAAYQTLVLRQAGIPIDTIFIAHVNNQFVLRTAGDYDGLIVEQDVTAQVESSLSDVADSAAESLSAMNSAKRPIVAMGAHCTSPYQCPFIERCTEEHGPTPQFLVTLLPRGGKTVDGLLADGYEDLTEVPGDRLTNALHQRVHEATVTGKPFFDPSATIALRAFYYPMTHLDFETMGFAVPEIIGSRPYEQLPFQFSIHIEDSPTTIRHREFLAIDTFGDFALLADHLIAAVPVTGPVFAYNASFEKRILQQLAERQPARRAALNVIIDRLVDLLPITRAAWYHRDMHGSWSIKAVLPTISPELNYANLGEVQAGDSAQMAFLEARNPATSPARRAELTQGLLAYCRQDTWAMIVLRRFLCDEPLPAREY